MGGVCTPKAVARRKCLAGGGGGGGGGACKELYRQMGEKREEGCREVNTWQFEHQDEDSVYMSSLQTH